MVSRRTAYIVCTWGEGARGPTSCGVHHDPARHDKLAPVQVGKCDWRRVFSLGVASEDACEKTHGSGGDEGGTAREVIDVFGLKGDRGDAHGVLDGEACCDDGKSRLGEGASEVCNVEEAMEQGCHGGQW